MIGEALLLQSHGAPYLTKHPFDEKMFFGLVDMIYSEDDKLYTWVGDRRVEISEEEAEEIIAKRLRQEIAFTPAEEFPE